MGEGEEGGWGLTNLASCSVTSYYGEEVIKGEKSEQGGEEKVGREGQNTNYFPPKGHGEVPFFLCQWNHQRNDNKEGGRETHEERWRREKKNKKRDHKDVKIREREENDSVRAQGRRA